MEDHGNLDVHTSQTQPFKAAGLPPLRITAARVIVTSPGRNFVTLKIETDQGVYGIGDATLNGREKAVVSYLEDHVIPVLIGRDAPLIEAALASTGVSLKHAGSMEEAVKLAAARAHPGDAVLLSPACASFDMFKDYAHRAEVFCEAVEAYADSPREQVGGDDAVVSYAPQASLSTAGSMEDPI